MSLIAVAIIVAVRTLGTSVSAKVGELTITRAENAMTKEMRLSFDMEPLPAPPQATPSYTRLGAACLPQLKPASEAPRGHSRGFYSDLRCHIELDNGRQP